MAEKALEIYLNDHLGLIRGELELARRVASENADTVLANFLSSYVEEVASQKDAIYDGLASLGERPSSLKETAGWLAEKLGRLKPNDGLAGYTDLARVIELEALLSAAQTRLLLWQTLAKLDPSPVVEAASFAQRTSQHLSVLQEHHEQAVGRAFGP